MNKKGGIQESTGLIVILIFAAILIILGLTYFVPNYKKLFGSTGPLEEGIKKDISEIVKPGTSFLFKQKEKCQQFSEIPKCIAPGTECFWGVFNYKAGCYSCKDNRYFGINFGKCEGYPLLGLDEETARLTCDTNPCKFIKPSKQDQELSRCSLSIGKVGSQVSSMDCVSVFQQKK